MAQAAVSRLEQEILSITLPTSEGTLTNSGLDALTDALNGVKQISCSAVVVRNDGEDFCRGRSLEPAAERPARDGPWGIEQRNADPVLRMFASLASVQVPVIAVVAGKAWGIGCALAAACDMAIAAVGSTFCLPEMRRGIPPTLAMSVLRDVVPPKTLINMVLTARLMNAQDALAAGLVTSVAAEGMLDDALAELAGTMRSASKVSLVTVKRYLRSTARMDAAAAADYASAMLACALASGSPG
jgi:enoyl-CoA hydratase